MCGINFMKKFTNSCTIIQLYTYCFVLKTGNVEFALREKLKIYEIV